ncbi:MAG: hypothetical protein RLZZ419_1803 [Pseudomonadota bacterium]|jgi:hypothetical protein
MFSERLQSIDDAMSMLARTHAILTDLSLGNDPENKAEKIIEYYLLEAQDLLEGSRL